MDALADRRQHSVHPMLLIVGRGLTDAKGNPPVRRPLATVRAYAA
jgi:hypothetical protein